MTQLNVGFIGTGRISDLHALEYLANPHARIAALCDTNLALAQQRAAAWNVPPQRIFASHHDLLALPDLDLVEILVPITSIVPSCSTPSPPASISPSRSPWPSPSPTPTA